MEATKVCTSADLQCCLSPPSPCVLLLPLLLLLLLLLPLPLLLLQRPCLRPMTPLLTCAASSPWTHRRVRGGDIQGQLSGLCV
jgi:hypothetical protein